MQVCVQNGLTFNNKEKKNWTIQVTVWCHLELTDSLTQESLLIYFTYPGCQTSVFSTLCCLEFWLSGAIVNILIIVKRGRYLTIYLT